jgi:hypothetical protein
VKRWLYRIGGRLKPENPLSTVAMILWRALGRKARTMTAYELCKRMGHPPSAHQPHRCLCGHKRTRLGSMIRDLRDVFSLTMHLRKHGL